MVPISVYPLTTADLKIVSREQVDTSERPDSQWPKKLREGRRRTDRKWPQRRAGCRPLELSGTSATRIPAETHSRRHAVRVSDLITDCHLPESIFRVSVPPGSLTVCPCRRARYSEDASTGPAERGSAARLTPCSIGTSRHSIPIAEFAIFRFLPRPSISTNGIAHLIGRSDLGAFIADPVQHLSLVFVTIEHSPQEVQVNDARGFKRMALTDIVTGMKLAFNPCGVPYSWH